MSAVAVRAGLSARVRSVSGLRVLTAEPASIHAAPVAIVTFIGGTLNQAGQVRAKTWRLAVRICVPFQDNVVADDQLVPLIDSVTTAILDDLSLSINGAPKANVVPRIDIGSEGDDGYYTIAETLFRSAVLRMDVMDKL